MRAILPGNRLQRKKISLDRKRIVVAQLRIRRIWEDRKIVLAFRVHPALERTQKIVIGPFTDTCDSVDGQNGAKLALYLPSPFDERLTKIGGRVYVAKGTLECQLVG